MSPCCWWPSSSCSQFPRHGPALGSKKQVCAAQPARSHPPSSNSHQDAFHLTASAQLVSQPGQVLTCCFQTLPLPGARTRNLQPGPGQRSPRSNSFWIQLPHLVLSGRGTQDKAVSSLVILREKGELPPASPIKAQQPEGKGKVVLAFTQAECLTSASPQLNARIIPGGLSAWNREGLLHSQY